MSLGDDGDPVARLLPELYALTPIERYPVRALSVTRQLVGGEKGDYTEVNTRTGEFRVLVDPEPPQLPLLAQARAAYMREHPVLKHYLNSDAPGSRMISDFLRPREFHRLGLYSEFFGPLGVEDGRGGPSAGAASCPGCPELRATQLALYRQAGRPSAKLRGTPP